MAAIAAMLSTENIWISASQAGNAASRRSESALRMRDEIDVSTQKYIGVKIALYTVCSCHGAIELINYVIFFLCKLYMPY